MENVSGIFLLADLNDVCVLSNLGIRIDWKDTACKLS